MRKVVIIGGILLVVIGGLVALVVTLVIPTLVATAPLAQEQGDVVVVEAPVEVIQQPAAETSSSAAVVLEPTPAPVEAGNARSDWVTYDFPTAPVSFQHPVEWQPGYSEQQSRGGFVNFELNGNSEAPVMSIVVYQWDPKNDLEAWVAQRMRGITGSGATVLAQEEITLLSGQRAIVYTMQWNLGNQGYLLFSTVGEDYLELNGVDVTIMREVAATLYAG